MKNNILFSAVGLLSLLSAAAFAEPAHTGLSSLEQVIQQDLAQKRAADARKYDQLITFAGDRKLELAKRKDVADGAYKKWYDLKSAVEASGNRANSNDYKAVELASRAYLDANKSYIDLQKDILAKSNLSPAEQASYIVVMH